MEETERSKLEKEITSAYKAYQELLISNEEIDNDNKAKDLRISKKEQEMADLTEKNKAELNQLELVRQQKCTLNA